MKFRLASALALSFAFTQVAAPAAFAQEPATQFRSVAAQSFSTQDLQRYGLSSADASQVHALQQQGYEVRVVTPEEAQQYSAGQFTNSQWLVIGLVVVLIVVAVAAD